MRKILLSTIAIVTIVTASNANSEIEVLKAQMDVMNAKLAELENKKSSAIVNAPKKKGTTVKSKVPVLKFSGKHYLGAVSSKGENSSRDNRFET
jgi:hypothetical protein